MTNEGGNMNKTNIIVTNNPSVYEDHLLDSEKLFVEERGMLNVLIKVRDMIYMGHELISHPLSGSLKPNENPFKSVIVSGGISDLDFDQVTMIENCIETCKKFLNNKVLPDYKEQVTKDFMYVDKTIIVSGLRN